MRDVLALRSGERWEPRLPELIEEADIFQLFWSSKSMRSRYCRNEWEHALSLERPSFIRPVYWERPLPQDNALELPPAGLRALHFVQVQAYMALPSAPQRITEAPAAYAPARQSPSDRPREWSRSSDTGRVPPPSAANLGGRARTMAVLVLALVVIAVLIAIYASR
ncbi:MAG: toll/interleukin-1 receptor domain-containing protein [Streptosporangiaceae bacterium]